MYQCYTVLISETFELLVIGLVSFIAFSFPRISPTLPVHFPYTLELLRTVAKTLNKNLLVSDWAILNLHINLNSIDIL